MITKFSFEELDLKGAYKIQPFYATDERGGFVKDYNIDMFNRCVNEGSLLIGVPEWKDIHPLIRMIPVEWDYAIPFGILHAPQPSAAVSRFLYAVRKVLSKG